MKKSFHQGFTLLATLFILIILAMAGVYLIKIGLTQVQIVNYTLLSARAQFALESAVNMAEQQWKTSLQCKDASYHFDKTAKSLQGYQITIRCLQTYHYPVQDPSFFALQLNVKAEHGVFGERDYVSLQKNKWLVLDNAPAMLPEALK